MFAPDPAVAFLLCASAVLAVLFGVAMLVLGRPLRDARLPLVVALGLAALQLLNAAYSISELAPRHPQWVGVSFPLAFAVPPLAWLATRELFAQRRVRGWRALVHFLPLPIFALALSPWYGAPLELRASVLTRLLELQPARMDVAGLINLQALMLQSLLYAVWSAQEFARAGLGTQDAAIGRRLARAGRGLRIACLVATLGIVAFGTAQLLGEHRNGLRAAGSAVMGLLVLALGLAHLSLPRLAAALEPARARPRYERAALAEDETRRLLERLELLMREERPWLDPQLGQGSLAGRLGLQPHQLSMLLNRELGASFAEYVNRHRVAEAQRQLRDPERAHSGILAIAHAVGFASKSSFNEAFRRHAGMTPSEWRRAAG